MTSGHATNVCEAATLCKEGTVLGVGECESCSVVPLLATHGL